MPSRVSGSRRKPRNSANPLRPFDAKKKKDLKRRGELAKFLAAARLRGGLGAPNSASVHSLFAPVLCLDGFALMSCR